MKKYLLIFISLLLACVLLFSSCVVEFVEEIPDEQTDNQEENSDENQEENTLTVVDNQPHVATERYGIAWYEGDEYALVNDNVPFFTNADKTTEVFELYADKDTLGRCGVAYANICEALMPTEERGNISSVKPTGWVQNSYSVIKSGSLYNRSHLIAFQLAGENANTANLITGTRYMNEAMIPFENMVADYVKETHHHVLYRVTPVFTDNNLLADGVLMEALSVEDDDICFCVFCYNVQPGIYLEYLTGNNCLASETPTGGDSSADTTDTQDGETVSYVLNTSSKKAHLPSCSSATSMADSNRLDYVGTQENFLAVYGAYSPCGVCKPYQKP